jgi:hypothetical protein
VCRSWCAGGTWWSSVERTHQNPLGTVTQQSQRVTQQRPRAPTVFRKQCNKRGRTQLCAAVTRQQDIAGLHVLTRNTVSKKPITTRPNKPRENRRNIFTYSMNVPTAMQILETPQDKRANVRNVLFRQLHLTNRHQIRNGTATTVFHHDLHGVQYTKLE